jgi:hypothetical protein
MPVENRWVPHLRTNVLGRKNGRARSRFLNLYFNKSASKKTVSAGKFLPSG